MFQNLKNHRQRIRYSRAQQEQAKQEQIALAQQAQLEREQAHLLEFFHQLAYTIRRFASYGQSVLNREMEKTLYHFYPLQPGYMHDWQVAWDYVEDGRIRFTYFDDKVHTTEAEANRQNMQAMANQIQWSMFFDTLAITSAIRHSRY